MAGKRCTITGPIELVREDPFGLLVAADVVTPGNGVPGAFDALDGLGVGDAREGLCDPLERRDVTLERPRELALVAGQHPRHDADQAVLSQIHVAGEIHVSDLWLDHPELGEMAAGLALLGAEGWAENVDLSERHRAGLAIELPALRQIGVAQVEVGHLEEGARSFAGRRGQDRRVQQREAVIVEVVADGLHDGVADPSRIACWRADRSQRWRCSIRKATPWSFGRDREILGGLNHGDIFERHPRSRSGCAARFFTSPCTMIDASWGSLSTAR